ncbi:nitroreductase [Candidatus Woesearchaeota archaeon CG10_big_fil_rev_8_21_14_0_10_36_11]|nr:MAG: nitroreductase [Candidatus Woesearchaeota archaeon CG10_big_fil_rev_8_21_14_0_10_36_11]
MTLHSKAKEHRTPQYYVQEMFYTRWSPRAMTGEEVSKEELLSLFEAARWAPSAFNEQPWRFIVAHTKEEREKFLHFLIEFNQEWCKNSAALVVIVSKKNFTHNNKENKTHEFDTGAAWMSLSLEGARRGLVVHGMSGILYDKIKQELVIPEDYEIHAMCVIGKYADASLLSEDMAKEEIPSQRKNMNDIVQWGTFTP